MSRLPTPQQRSFHLLNATQFLGALNDNIFKLLIIYFLIHLKGPENTNTVISLAGSLFVIPFLLFSSAAGILADKVSKRRVIISTKIVEIVVMALGSFAMYCQSEFFCYTLLFLMGAQSTAFGPSKYSIIPEIVAPENLSKANGSITALTYIAMILGSVVSSLLMQATGDNFLLISFVCCAIAVLGTVTSFGIETTNRQTSNRKASPFFLVDIYKALSLSSKRSFLLPAILGSSFFLFIGGFVHLNVIPFAMESLQLSAVAGGYLFAATAIGIAIGARLAGKLSQERVELGLSCLAGFCIVLLFFLLTIFSQSLIAVVCLLTLLGIFGGLFVIPLESFIQASSPEKRRGQIIAANNFLSFGCVFLASSSIYLFNQRWGFSASGSFVLMGCLTLVCNALIAARMSSLFFPYFMEKVALRWIQLRSLGGIEKPCYMVLQRYRILDILLLSYVCKDLHVVAIARPWSITSFFTSLSNAIFFLRPSTNHNTTLQRLFVRAKHLKKASNFVAVIVNKNYSEEMILKAYEKTFGKKEPELYLAKVEKEPTKGLLRKRSYVCSFQKIQKELPLLEIEEREYQLVGSN
ncbi:MAG: MFS transporter [Chlamydiota bacterium]